MSGTMSSFRLMPVRSSRGVFRSVEKMRTVFSPQSCSLVLLEVHDTVELHIVHLADKQPSFADKLLAADAVAYPAQAEEAVQQDKQQAEEDGNARNGKGHVLQASVDASGTAHGKGRQLVDDELHLVWSQYETFRL